jgi:hypothetical protein
MNKLTLAIAALVIGLGTASATAMPVDNLAGVGTGLKVDQVRIVCNAWGRCWRRPNYDYGAYGYYPRRHIYRGWGWRHYRRW